MPPITMIRARQRDELTAFGYQNTEWQFSQVSSIFSPASNSACEFFASIAASAGFNESWNCCT